MAIYSCNLKSIGRTTHAAGTAGAHIRYISRPEAEPTLLSSHMPHDHREARTWIDSRERAMRKNGRVIDKLRIALPRELTEEQRAALVEEFMAELTGGRIPWFAAIHQRGSDEQNPHVHIAVHDRDIESGKRVLRLSDSARDRRKAGLPGPKAVDWIRERWEVVCNKALEREGHAVRIDRRTLDAQGVDRQAGIHEGPRAQHIEGNVKRPESRKRINGCGRVIDYPSIDHGRTRREFNAHIIDLNLERAARSKDAPTSIWALFEKEELAKDRALEKRLAGQKRQRTDDMRSSSAAHLDTIRQLRAERDDRHRAAVNKVRQKYEPQRETMRARQAQEREELKDRQSRLHLRLLRTLDITGTTRRKQEAARKLLSARHREARKALTDRYRTARQFAEDAIRFRYTGTIGGAESRRLSDLAKLKELHELAALLADKARQQREIEREHLRRIAESKIETWKKERKQSGPLGVESDFAAALKRAARQETRRGKGRGRDDDSGRER